jgi:ESF2/ABP1 family protein
MSSFEETPRGRKRPLPPDQLAPEKLEEFAAAEKSKGLVHLGRIPPGMKPLKIRHLLTRFGDIGRIFLSPEDPAALNRRIKAGGNKKLRFTEGWVEFNDKAVARGVAEMLNNTGMTEGKRGFYGADLWNIKFLPHFKWHHLTEKLTYERRIKRDKLRGELAAVRKDAEAYVEQADRARGIRKMQEKRAAGGSAPAPESAAEQGEVMRRTFKQKQGLRDATMDGLGPKRPRGNV